MLKLKQSIALSVVLLLFVALTPQLDAAPKREQVRHNVLDYFWLLPGIGTIGYQGKQRRELLSASYEPVIDLKNDWMSVNPDSAPREQIAVFRYRGAELVAQSAPDYQSDYNGFALYRLHDGKLRDVTKEELPVPVRQDRYLYEVPRYGTTIRVYKFDLFKGSRRRAFDLKWRNGKFVRAKIS